MSDKNLLANPIGFNFPSFCFCHYVAPNPFVLASVVRIFSLSALKWAGHGSCVINFFKLLNASVCSCVQFHSFCFFSNFLRISVCADKFSMYFARYWIAYKNDFGSFSFFGISIFVMASNLSCRGLIPFWYILCPIHCASCLKNSHLFGCSLYPAFLAFPLSLLPPLHVYLLFL